jgi:CRP-like cAMP-binding protein
VQLDRFLPFVNAPPAELTAVAAQMQRLQRPAGTVLYTRGDVAGGMYLVEAGLVAFSQLSRDGRRVTLAYTPPGLHFGEVELLSGTPRDTDALVVVDCRLWMLSAERFHALFEHSGWFARNLCRFSNRMRQWVTDSRGNDLLSSLEVRLARTLIELLQYRREPNGTLRLSQDELASTVGSSRQSVNRHLQRWRAAGWVRGRYGEIEVIDLDALVTLARLTPDS